ncbi:MAG: MOSC domain-containing protein, partial [Opitutaceae bacterium]|nr:MOSC domain-containing protein [Opitutaceae bacterium]
ALITTELGRDSLILRNPHHGSAAVGLHEPGAPLTVQVWRDTVEAEACSVEIDVWLSDFLRQPCRLVRIGQNYRRPVKPAKAQPGDVFTFADGYPMLALGEASLADLNDRLVAQGEAPVPMDRFRPNLVIAGSAAFAEDTWPRFRIGDLTFRTTGPCARCTITTTDQQTAARGKEPLRTLATYRRDQTEPTNLNFGQNLVHETKSGSLRVGDAISIIK